MSAKRSSKPVIHSAVARTVLVAALMAALSACSAETAPAEAANAGAPQGGTTQPADSSAGNAPSRTAGAAHQVDPAKVDQIVKDMLAKAYGAQSFNAAKGCWSHQFEGANGELDYCMKAGAPKVVATSSGNQVYVQTYSDPDEDAYSLVDAGLRGLFAATVAADGSWKPLAATPAMDQGQAGDCGCVNAELVQVGPEAYGWLSTAGGTWQGVTVANNDLQVPIEGTFRNVSGIPASTEAAPDETIRIQMDTQGAPVAGFYPIKATRVRDGKELGTTVVAFDPSKKTYPWAQ